MSSKNERVENEDSVKIDVDSTGTKQSMGTMEASTSNPPAEDPINNDVVGLLSKKIKEIKGRLMKPEEPIICRVPDYIKGDHGKEYEPNILAIGPYHRSTGGRGKLHPRLKPMEDIKLQFLINLCQREANIQRITEDDVLQTFTKIVRAREIKARKKYSESILQRMSSEVFVETLIVDGCFIIEFMLQVNDDKYTLPLTFQENNDKYTLPLTFRENVLNAIRRDLLLFENQIPFFIVEEIYRSCSSTTDVGEPISSSLVDYALNTVNRGIKKEMLPNEYSREDNPEKIHHLLHLCHLSMVSEKILKKANDPENCTTIFCNVIKTSFSCLVVFMIFILLLPVLLLLVLLLVVRYCWKYLSGDNKKYETPMEPQLIPTATQLAEYGVQFRKKDISNVKNILNVSFKDGMLEIPHTCIDDGTSSMYRNLIALEQSCDREYGNKFTSYVCFMDDLIDTTYDVALLTKNKILKNDLGSEKEVAIMFNEMCIELIYEPNNHYFVDMYEEISKYCDKTYNKWRATLMRDYFNSPWSIISVIAVSFVLYLAVVQTVCSIIEVI